MGEVIQFPGNNINPQENTGGDVAKHFEGPKDIVQEQIKTSHGMIEKMFPNLFMTPGEVVKFLEITRGRVEQIEKQAA